MAKKECPSCAMQVDNDSKDCPICGYEFPEKNKGFILVAILLIIVAVIYFIL